jgi:hypothetical protein
MADDENSNFVANDAEQEVIREPRNSLSGYHAPGLKKIFWLVCGLGHEITKLGVKLLLRALESQRARSNHYPLSPRCPNRPSDLRMKDSRISFDGLRSVG